MTDEPNADVPPARGARTTAAGERPGGSPGTGSGPARADRGGGPASGPDARTAVLQVAGAATAGAPSGPTTGATTSTTTGTGPGTGTGTGPDATAPADPTGAATSDVATAPAGAPSGPTTSTSAGTTTGTGPGTGPDATAPADPTGAATSDVATAPAGDPPGPDARPARRGRRWPVVLLTLLLVAALGAAGYLLATTRAYAERLQWTEQQARAIGTELTVTRGELDGARGEIAALQAQLTTAQERITALADEKAQIGDDREAQRQLLDYQARVSEAAGTVASALDRCVQGQGQLIAYLEDAASYDPAQLSQFGADVEALCQSASEANEALQSELADR